jgi:GMP synthase PP-ATPase subunit
MKLKLLEPLRELFKDEVRKLGVALDCRRHGASASLSRVRVSGVRILGEIQKPHADLLRRADAIFIEELRRDGSLRQGEPGVRGVSAGALGRRHGRWAAL